MKKNKNTSATQQVAEVKTVEKVVTPIQTEESENQKVSQDELGEQENQLINSSEILEKSVNNPEVLKIEETEKQEVSSDEIEEQKIQPINSPKVFKTETNEMNAEINDLTFELDGEKYTFTSDSPKKLQIDNKVYLVQDLLTNKEILNSLVVGESAFVKKI